MFLGSQEAEAGGFPHQPVSSRTVWRFKENLLVRGSMGFIVGTRFSLEYQWSSGVFFGFETKSLKIGQAGLELMGYTYLCLLSAWIL